MPTRFSKSYINDLLKWSDGATLVNNDKDVHNGNDKVSFKCGCPKNSVVTKSLRYIEESGAFCEHCPVGAKDSFIKNRKLPQKKKRIKWDLNFLKRLEEKFKFKCTEYPSSVHKSCKVKFVCITCNQQTEKVLKNLANTGPYCRADSLKMGARKREAAKISQNPAPIKKMKATNVIRSRFTIDYLLRIIGSSAKIITTEGTGQRTKVTLQFPCKHVRTMGFETIESSSGAKCNLCTSPKTDSVSPKKGITITKVPTLKDKDNSQVTPSISSSTKKISETKGHVADIFEVENTKVPQKMEKDIQQLREDITEMKETMEGIKEEMKLVKNLLLKIAASV